MNKGMTKVSVMYSKKEDTTFDMDYYTQKHLPWVGELLGDAVKGSALEQGLGGPEGSPGAYVVMSHLYFDSVEAFESSFGPNAEAIMADIPNYTNAEPVIQISSVIV